LFRYESDHPIRDERKTALWQDGNSTKIRGHDDVTSKVITIE
jgi:hypothetical protein